MKLRSWRLGQSQGDQRATNAPSPGQGSECSSWPLTLRFLGPSRVGKCRNGAQQPQQRLGSVGLYWSQHTDTCHPMGQRDRHSPVAGAHRSTNKPLQKTARNWPGRTQRAKWISSSIWSPSARFPRTPVQGEGTSTGGCLGTGTGHLCDVPYWVPKPVRRGVPKEAVPGASHLLCFSSFAPRVWQPPQGSGSCNWHARLCRGVLAQPAALPVPIPVLPTITGSSRLSLSVPLYPCSALLLVPMASQQQPVQGPNIFHMPTIQGEENTTDKSWSSTW